MKLLTNLLTLVLMRSEPKMKRTTLKTIIHLQLDLLHTNLRDTLAEVSLVAVIMMKTPEDQRTGELDTIIMRVMPERPCGSDLMVTTMDIVIITREVIIRNMDIITEEDRKN